MEKGLLIVISGPSGTGKGTICKKVIENSTDLEVSVSATTRKPRIGEIDGVNYYFINEEDFKERINNNDFLEHAFVYGNYYGTPKSNIMNKLNAGISVILEIDIQGALKVRKSHDDGVFIFILPPSLQELQKRIVSRGTDSEKVISNRLKCTKEELEFAVEYDYVVLNDDLLEATDKVRKIIDVEKMKSHRNIDLVEQIKEEQTCTKYR
ncbi:guanylate kinase [Sedimentibacter sp. zth1]|uniref:guanylate kinase n=1 Tax=Sedimentibacter sp. zth1 TaxID=2816908 RepID=UPI001A9396C9|nr:guanylate kinase [Sedimentibacter sp. zth1]QSX06866.1 guanylate kinase [Sedimentibacter sp. zth1]